MPSDACFRIPRAIFRTMVLACTLVVAACGGAGDGTPPGASEALPQQAAQALRKRIQAVPAAAVTPQLAPEDAALQLMDFAEAALPGYFPSRQPTQSLSPFLYRLYPETGVILGVVVVPDAGYPYLGVYVLGGTFGSTALYVGTVPQLIQPQAAPAGWLLQGVGARGPGRAETIVQYFDFGRTSYAPNWVVVDKTDPGRWLRVEPSGVAASHAQVFAADVDADTTETRRLRERWRTVFKNGRLHRLDLEPPAGQAPSLAQVSSLSTLALCADDQQVFQNWVDPSRAWFIFPAPAEGVNNCYSARSYRAVRLGMATTEAPLRLTARPIDAVRDARGAIEGFILEEGDGERILLTDADFNVLRVLADSTAAKATEDLHRVKPYGIHGRGAGRYLLYLHDSHYGEDRWMGQPLTTGSAAQTLVTSTQGDPVVAEDSSGLYLMAQRRLVHVDPSLRARELTAALPVTDGRLFLTPTRVVMVAGNISPNAVVSVLKSGGDPEVVASLSGNGSAQPALVVLGEEVYVQRHWDAGVLIVRADGSNLQGPISGYIAAGLRPVSWFRNQEMSGFEYGGDRGPTFGAEGAASVLIVEDSYIGAVTLGGARVVRYDEGRLRRVVGQFPQVGSSEHDMSALLEANGVRLVSGPGGVRRLGLHQVGGIGLVYEKRTVFNPLTVQAHLWWLDPSGVMAPIDVSGAWN